MQESILFFRITLITILQGIFCITLWGNSAGDARPVLVIERSPGSKDSRLYFGQRPVFIAYSNGTVIWAKGFNPSHDSYMSSEYPQLPSQVTGLIKEVSETKNKRFVLTAAEDAEITTIWCEGKKITIVGNWREPDVLKSDSAIIMKTYTVINAAELKMWATLPPGIRNGLESVLNFPLSMAVPWHPETIEVELSPAGPALGNPISWPEDWPSAYFRTSSDPSALRIKLPGSLLLQTEDLLFLQKKPRAVIFNGDRKFGRIRYLFSGHDIWEEKETIKAGHE